MLQSEVGTSKQNRAMRCRIWRRNQWPQVCSIGIANQGKGAPNQKTTWGGDDDVPD
ncbi:uncharacterized protein BO97DRAFT_403969 [Aspergillus homomorphus CBS 101889]|uniref:Uncharacterized protein n=1 Tax=Aspergillus homomorphus (strain CBS 101889) TaxID=1450537 RepID=A0A395I776_ASPHC|nr:hypothetical protein BO97DRAFT_403969 [Aspergillus homomorphus CBS 101889]RAL14948.1 hypothetical protein BO97DRAFT_403969 [Aspergillus homomorphus CBS 101889]